MFHARLVPRLLLIFTTLIGVPNVAFSLTESERDHLRMISEWLPYSVCQDNKYLKQCFLWSTDECEGTTEKTATSCLNMYKAQWSAPITSSIDKWQDKLIDCVQRDIQAKLKTRAVASIMCKNKGGK